MIAVENNDRGHTTVTRLRETYYNLYTEVTEDKITKKNTERLGFKTTSASKPKILSLLKTALNEEAIKINSKPLLSELKDYDAEGLNETRFKEDTTNHFDLVMALAIA